MRTVRRQSHFFLRRKRWPPQFSVLSFFFADSVCTLPLSRAAYSISPAIDLFQQTNVPTFLLPLLSPPSISPLSPSPSSVSRPTAHTTPHPHPPLPLRPPRPWRRGLRYHSADQRLGPHLEHGARENTPKPIIACSFRFSTHPFRRALTSKPAPFSLRHSFPPPSTADHPLV